MSLFKNVLWTQKWYSILITFFLIRIKCFFFFLLCCLPLPKHIAISSFWGYFIIKKIINNWINARFKWNVHKNPIDSHWSVYEVRDLIFLNFINSHVAVLLTVLSWAATCFLFSHHTANMSRSSAFLSLNCYFVKRTQILLSWLF